MTNEVLSNQKSGAFLGISDIIMAWLSIFETMKHNLMCCLKEDIQK